MRKRIINVEDKQAIKSELNFLDIDKIAVVEVSSEYELYPIESALQDDQGSHWRASTQGKQLIRLIFDNPQQIKWIRLKFEEFEVERTQEYVIRWSADDGQSFQEIVRQQWNFSPTGSSTEIEEYQLELSGVTILELSINPNISDNNAFASLKELRLA